MCTCASYAELTEKLELMSPLFRSKAVWMCIAVNPDLFFWSESTGTIIEVDWRLV